MSQNLKELMAHRKAYKTQLNPFEFGQGYDTAIIDAEIQINERIKELKEQERDCLKIDPHCKTTAPWFVRQRISELNRLLGK